MELRLKELVRVELKILSKQNSLSKDSHQKSQRLSSRNKQHSVKARLVYKKESLKTMNSNNMKNEITLGGRNHNFSKIENKENDFIQANTSNNLKFNRTSSGRNSKNIQSMSGIRKLNTLKSKNTNRRLESQSYRDLNRQSQNNEAIKNEKVQHGSTNIYNSTINNKKNKRNLKLKTSSSETPKLRSQNEAMFSGIKAKINQRDIGDKENMKPNNNYTANWDTRLLKKPPNPSLASRQVKSSNYIKQKPPTATSRIESYKNDSNADVSKKQEQEELMKRNKVQHQIMNHLKTGNLPENPIITPIMSNDGQIRQYILNDPISNPEDAEPEIALLPSDKITNTTVDKSKCSTRKNGIVKAYAANTNRGIIRNYNEDRVSIILNILKPHSRKGEEWPKCSFFGVFDGHGGAAWADFLRDNLHQFVIKEPSFPKDPEEALRKGFVAAEKVFTDSAQEKGEVIEKSGSWAIVILIVGDDWYVVNVGDSRAVLSHDQGRKGTPLSIDHKPSESSERKRIYDSGGQIYQTATVASAADPSSPPEIIIGPIRVFPGRLSVSRTFGDTEAKITAKGGNPNVVIWTPEIRSFKIDKSHDFIILGWDGIFDKLTDKEWVSWVWNSVYQNLHLDVHQLLGLGAEWIMKNSLNKRSLDNVTVVIIAFSGFKETVASLKSRSKRTEHVSSVFKNEKRSNSYMASSKSQRSSSQNQILGVARGFPTHNTLM